MKNNSKKINVLFLAAEVAPLAKVGGLGDVAGALPKAMADLKININLCLPFYGLIDAGKYKIKKARAGIAFSFGGREEKINLWQTFLPGTKIKLHLIEHDYFAAKEIYQGGRILLKGKYSRGESDLNRFAFFGRACLAATEAINFKPDIIHLNDWHTANVARLLKTELKNDAFFKNTKTLYTIHNLANQGISKIEGINYMAEGIINSDLVNTVSPTYSREILTKEYGAGLENILFKRKKRLFGVLNGIDTDFFNPKTDKLIKHNYSSLKLAKKNNNKTELQRELGLAHDKNTALVGMVTRFVGQKGIDLITEKFLKLNCQFVFLGTGEKKYEDALTAYAKKYPKKFSVQIKFDEKLAHKIYAASDIFLVPSRFEPCGLTQMVAMRYGSVPVVRATGGLKDTVDAKTGFKFKEFNSDKLYNTLKKALDVFYNRPGAWRALMINGMKRDFSWNKPAREYLELYKKLLK